MSEIAYCYNTFMNVEYLYPINDISEIKHAIQNYGYFYMPKGVIGDKLGQTIIHFLNGDMDYFNNILNGLEGFKDIENIRNKTKIKVDDCLKDMKIRVIRDYRLFDEVYYFPNIQNRCRIPLPLKDEKVEYIILPNHYSNMDLYIINSLEQLLYFSLLGCEKGNVAIKKCELCGKYFIPKQRRDAKYCDNIYLDTGKTCKEYVHMIATNNRKKNDDVYRLYRNIYDKKSKQVIRNSKDETLKYEVEIWKKEAKSIYEKYKNKEISSEEFQEWLDKNN